MSKLLLFVISIYTLSCQLDTIKLDETVNYQRDLKIKIEYEIDKQKIEDECEGFCLVDRAIFYKVTVYPLGKADMILMTSHHRELKKTDPDQSWWTKGVSFDFYPVAIEYDSSLDIGVYEKEKGRHAWGMISFKSAEDTLQALQHCNGRSKMVTGTSICQAKEGLVQEIAFFQPVKVKWTQGCNIQIPTDGKNFKYIMPEGECIFFFGYKDKTTNKIFTHKHITYGYNNIPIRSKSMVEK